MKPIFPIFSSRDLEFCPTTLKKSFFLSSTTVIQIDLVLQTQVMIRKPNSIAWYRYSLYPFVIVSLTDHLLFWRKTIFIVWKVY